jgi:hypothetical protein
LSARPDQRFQIERRSGLVPTGTAGNEPMTYFFAKAWTDRLCKSGVRMTFHRPRTLKIVSASLLLVLIFVTIAKMVMFEIEALSSQRAHSSERFPQIDWSVYRQW